MVPGRGPILSFFIWLESTAPSVWVRESPSLLGFPFILYLHTLGLAMIAGLSSAVALSLLCLRSPPRAATWLGLFRLIWLGLGINVLSGILLLIAYPAKALTNPVFFVKMLAIAVAVGIVHWLERQLTSSVPTALADASATVSSQGLPGDLPGATAAQRRAAIALLLLWLIATLTGRLLAYTYSILMARETLYF
jgi:hypothetical protein